jgi:hypothetical protein
MSDEQEPVPASQRFPTWKQALLMFGGGVALTVSARHGCDFVGDRAREGTVLEFVATFLMVLVPVGVLVTFVGVLLVLMRVLQALFGKHFDD